MKTNHVSSEKNYSTAAWFCQDEKLHKKRPAVMSRYEAGQKAVGPCGDREHKQKEMTAGFSTPERSFLLY